MEKIDTPQCVDGYHGIELEEADRHKTTYLRDGMGKVPLQESPSGIPDTYCQVTATADTPTPSWRIVHQQHLTETLRR